MNEEKLDFLIKQNYATQELIEALFIYLGMEREQLKDILDLLDKEIKEEMKWLDE